MTLSGLITAVERAEGPSREIDGMLAVFFGGAVRPDEDEDPPITASIDAVVALIRREMRPDAQWGFCCTSGEAEAFVNCPAEPFIETDSYVPGNAGRDPALALLLAFLRAARARQENDTP